jgi:hypothetical protein
MTRMNSNRPILTTSLMLVLTASLWAAERPAAKKAAKPAPPPGPKPTLANVSYGSHPKQVLDFWKAESARPTPLLFFIHGGGWQGGSKNRVGGVPEYLSARTRPTRPTSASSCKRSARPSAPLLGVSDRSGQQAPRLLRGCVRSSRLARGGQEYDGQEHGRNPSIRG